MKIIDFNGGWTCENIRTGECRSVTLPHDAMIAEPRTATGAGGKNIGWFTADDYVYRKRFDCPQAADGDSVFLEFEGVYKDAEVWLNGEFALSHANGYTGFRVPLNGRLRPGSNEVAVKAVNSDQPNSRWYTGTGIYRPVRLCVVPADHIADDGVRIVTMDAAARRVSVRVLTCGKGSLDVRITDGDVTLASQTRESSGDDTFVFELSGAKLWSCDRPYLYVCRVTFGEDARAYRFGIRQIGCDAEHGFRINGERVVMFGACVHHDNGGLGACAHPFAEKRKIRLLREAGFNAIRSSHNPCSAALLDACDEYGMLVVDEYADTWYIHKTKYDYTDHVASEWQNDLAAMVEKDRNHPSVVMYSLGNEVAETSQPRGIKFCRTMAEHLRSLDERPVTCGVNIFFNLLGSLGLGIFTDEKAAKSDEIKKEKPKIKKEKAVGSEFFNKLASIYGSTTMKLGALLPGCGRKTRDAFAALDAAGYNYGIFRYKRDVKKYKGRVIVGTETFASDARRFRLLAEKLPAVIGDLVWTGIDYLGEAGIGAWEYPDYAPDFSLRCGWLTGGAGMLDLNGRAWGQMLYLRTANGLDPVRVAVVRPDRAFTAHTSSAWRFSNALESWSWQGCEGKKTQVEVYSSCYKVELLINGRSAGKKRIPKKGRVNFKVPYEAGALEAVAYDAAGREVGRTSLQSAGEETVLAALPEQPEVPADGLCYVRLRYTDGRGIIKPLARGDVRVETEGGELLALVSACPYNERGYTSNVTDTYYGEALAVVRPIGESVTLRAFSALGDASTTIAVKKN